MLYSTIGKDIYPGFELKLYFENEAQTIGKVMPGRYRLVHVKEGFGIYLNGTRSQLFSAPSMICINEKESVEFVEVKDLKLQILYFDPCVYNKKTTFEEIEKGDSEYKDDLWIFTPFKERTESYIGINKMNYLLSQRLSKLMSLGQSELLSQKDDNWPCRSRSYFIEILALLSTVFYSETDKEKMMTADLSDEFGKIIHFLHVNYPEKITIEHLTKEFHTNKTTLNRNFRQTIGVTVIEYLNNLRIQIACSFLRNTELSVNEIMERVGFRYNAHFLRTFKKYAHCQPSIYRAQNARPVY